MTIFKELMDYVNMLLMESFLPFEPRAITFIREARMREIPNDPIEPDSNLVNNFMIAQLVDINTMQNNGSVADQFLDIGHNMELIQLL